MTRLPGGGIYAITDCENFDRHEFLVKTDSILRAGAAMLQYRDKGTDIDERLSMADKTYQLCKQYNVPLIINDDPELALEIDADGVHIGKADATYDKARKLLGQDRIIGISCYNDIERAIVAERLGADYIAFGSFFPSVTKANAVRADLTLLKQARKKLNLPIVAIGGITPENGRQLVESGANFLAVINGLYSSADTYKATQAYLELFNNND